MAVASRSFSHYLFVDEAGDIAQRNTAHVITCVVVTTDRHIPSRIVRRTRNQFRELLANSGPLHASQNKPLVVRYLLNQIAKQDDFYIVAGILDRNYLLESPDNRNELYQRLVAYTVRLAFTVLKIPTDSAHVIIEQSFTNATLNATFESRVSEAIDIAHNQVVIAPKTNREWGHGLQVADYVTWSLFQKYERQNEEFADLLRKRIICENLVGSIGGQIRSIDELWR